jgi:UrcA family protein
MKTITLLLASATCYLSVVPAFAQTGDAPLTVTGSKADDPDTIRVSYADLDMASPADVAMLQTRVRTAARRTCDAMYAGSMLEMSWACRDVVAAVAKPQIAAAIERARTGQDLAARAVVVVRFAKP